MDTQQLRRNLYLGSGYHIIRQYLDEYQVQNLSQFWSGRGNKTVRRYIKKRMLYGGCPNVSHLTADIDRHFNYFWNEPAHDYTQLIAWQLQSLRNQIEGNPANQDFMPHLLKNRVDPDYQTAASCRIVTTRDGGSVPPHIDWPLDHSRLQFELMLSSYGRDYSGGLCLDDRFRNGCSVNLCREHNLQAGDLLIFRYGRRHGVESIQSGQSGRGFSRLMMPLESIPVRCSVASRLIGAGRNILLPLRNELFRPNEQSVPSSYDESPFANGRLYYDDDIRPLMDIAIDSGFPPSEVFYHKGLWARFKMFADWQFDALRRHGLKPHHNVLDIGCGFMRLGMQLVPFLDDDRYCGIDPIQGYLDLADQYMKGVVDCGKQYRLLAETDFGFEQFGRQFDFAMAHSVFTHMSFDQIEKCFRHLKQVMKSGGRFLFTICLGRDRQDNFVYVNETPMTHSRHDDPSMFESLAAEIGFQFEFQGRSGHPTQSVCSAIF